MAVYFIRDVVTNLIKIGYSSRDPAKRLSALQIGNASRLELLGSRAGEKTHETSLHRYFKCDNVRGEWYRMSPSLAAEIALCNPDFAALAKLDPDILGIARAAGGLSVQDIDDKFCACAVWYGYDGGGGIKQLLLDVVGWHRKNGPAELQSPHAYDVVYETVFDILPDCRDCNCLSPDFVMGM